MPGGYTSPAVGGAGVSSSRDENIWEKGSPKSGTPPEETLPFGMPPFGESPPMLPPAPPRPPRPSLPSARPPELTGIAVEAPDRGPGLVRPPRAKPKRERERADEADRIPLIAKDPSEGGGSGGSVEAKGLAEDAGCP